jgi:hypothetical protein
MRGSIGASIDVAALAGATGIIAGAASKVRRDRQRRRISDDLHGADIRVRTSYGIIRGGDNMANSDAKP